MNEQISPIDKSNMSARVYNEVREALVAGRFLPDERIRLQDMAERFGTSVTPVREALLRLVSERALHMQAAKMISVPPLNLERYLELRTIRLQLEPLAAELATERIGPSELSKLVDLNAQFEKAGAQRDADARMGFNRAFHFGIYNLCGLPTLQAIIENLWASMGPVLKAYFLHNKAMSFIDPDQHRTLLTALHKRDGKAAAEAIRQDILGAAPSIISFLEEIEELEKNNDKDLRGGKTKTAK